MTEDIFSEPEVMYFHPCVKDKTKISADIKLKKALNVKSIYKLAKITGLFTNVKYSEDLDLLKFDYKGKTLLMFGNGTVEIRSAENQEDVKETLEFLDRISKEAVETEEEVKDNGKTYSDTILEHIKDPKNMGELSDADATGTVTSPICGDIMNISIKVEDGKIVDAKFKTLGCGVSIATSDVITELAKGKTLEEAQRVTREDVIKALNGVPEMKLHCSNLAVDSLHAAVEDYIKKKGKA